MASGLPVSKRVITKRVAGDSRGQDRTKIPRTERWTKESSQRELVNRDFRCRGIPVGEVADA